MFLSEKYLSFVYLIFAIAGAILTFIPNLQFIDQYGPVFDIALFIKMANINPAAQSLSSDLFVSASAIMIWMFVETRRLSIKHFWLVLLSTFLIAFAFGAPLFLFLRERRLLELKN